MKVVRRTPPGGARGFTLIEIMIVVAIIGIIASMATPTFTLLTLRSKAAERHEVMQRIKKAVSDFYVQNGTTIPRGETDPLAGTFQPAWPPEPSKRMPNFATPGWSEVFRTGEEIEGALYYSYTFTCTEPVDGSRPELTIEAWGDLDGDGVASPKTLVYERVNGVYQLKSPGGETPPPGAEDALTF